jgi:hypothetical protein
VRRFSSVSPQLSNSNQNGGLYAFGYALPKAGGLRQPAPFRCAGAYCRVYLTGARCTP